MDVQPIRVQGLAELNRSLRRLSSDAPKALRHAHNSAADIVASTAAGDVVRKSGRAARSIAARSTRTAARVTAGGKKAPYFPWLDYGGRVGPRRSVKREWREGGRYVYPAWNRRRDEVTERLSAALMDVVRDAGLSPTEA